MKDVISQIEVSINQYIESTGKTPSKLHITQQQVDSIMEQMAMYYDSRVTGKQEILGYPFTISDTFAIIS